MNPKKDEKLSNRVSARIRQLSREREVTIHALAVACGVHPTTAFRWRKGETLPGARHIRRVAKALGTSVKWLTR